MTSGKSLLGDAEFGELLSHYRQAAGWTQEELSAASQVSVRAIGNIERGRTRAPQQRSAEALADSLGLLDAERDAFLTAARQGRHRGKANHAPPEKPFLPVGALCSLPRAGELTGRKAELDRLRELAESARNGVVVLTGLPGVGKTSLVVAAAHQMRDDFPGGQFFLDLHGMDDQPPTSDDLLERLLRAVGVPGDQIPRSLDERSSLWRSMTWDRRVLLVLDNAADEAQVRPLIPGGSRCLSLVTARRVLAGLEVTHRISLDVLSHLDAVSLLSDIVGHARVEAEPEAVDEVVSQCGELPLALRIAGNRLASRPQWTIRALADQLSDQRRRLEVLRAGDLNMLPVFSMSYRQLNELTQLVFRRLALVPGTDFSAPLAAAIAEVSPETAEEALTELCDASLLNPATSECRYRFHDLVRGFATEMLNSMDDSATRTAAVDRMTRWLLHTATEAGDLLHSDSLTVAKPEHSEPVFGIRAFSNSAAATAWLEAEMANWFPAVAHAARRGWHRAVISVAQALNSYSGMRTQPRRWQELHEHAVAAARSLGSRRDEAILLNGMGWTLHYGRGEHERAVEVLRRAVELAVYIRDPYVQGWGLRYLAACETCLERPDDAIDHNRRAIVCFMAAKADYEAIHTAYQLSRVLHERGRFAEALEIQWKAMTRLTEAGLDGYPGLRGLLLLSMADSLAADQRWDEAVHAYREAAEALRVSQDWLKESEALAGQAQAHHRIGEGESAQRRLVEAHSVFQRANELWTQAQTLHRLAMTCEDPETTSQYRQQALALWRRLGNEEPHQPSDTLAAKLRRPKPDR